MSDKTNEEKLRILQERLTQIKQKEEEYNQLKSQYDDAYKTYERVKVPILEDELKNLLEYRKQQL